MLTWWRERRERQRRERRAVLEQAVLLATYHGDDVSATYFRRELDRMGGR